MVKRVFRVVGGMSLSAISRTLQNTGGRDKSVPIRKAILASAVDLAISSTAAYLDNLAQTLLRARPVIDPIRTPAVDTIIQHALAAVDGRFCLVILLSGPPGTGKSHAAYVAKQILLDEYKIKASAHKLEEYEVFPQRGSNELCCKEAYAVEIRRRVRIAVLDEVDRMIDGRQSKIKHLLSYLDESLREENLVVVMTTNNPDKIDAAITRLGRVHIHLVVPYWTAEEAAPHYDKYKIKMPPTGLSPADLEGRVKMRMIKRAKRKYKI